MSEKLLGIGAKLKANWADWDMRVRVSGYENKSTAGDEDRRIWG